MTGEVPPAGWYPDPSGEYETRYWDGSSWTAHVTGTPAAWYPDPSGDYDKRYWDGTSWTEHVVPRAAPTSDLLPSDPTPVVPPTRADQPLPAAPTKQDRERVPTGPASDEDADEAHGLSLKGVAGVVVALLVVALVALLLTLSGVSILPSGG